LDDKHLRSISPQAQGINYLKRSGELQLGLNQVKLGKVYNGAPHPAANNNRPTQIASALVQSRQSQNHSFMRRRIEN